ncbi:hypothetical protein [Actinoplanes sp. DH11]|uniref:hypothetical protein n=1 Tax=Actinoplanes sp. DH11 TaxID=2857011 RepID=UPI001E2BB453|nr:hypothetical protein [Actinoplanes sp. DH11]
MHPETWGGSEWQAVAAFIAIFVAGPIAFWQAHEARKVRLDQSRPYVIVDFEFRDFLVYLKIQNIGKTMARDVRIKFDQPLTSTLANPGFTKSRLLREPIPMLAPGRSVSLLFDSFPDRYERRKKFPMDHTVTIEYDDDRGTPYTDPPYPLDLDAYVGASSDPKGLAELVREVEKIRHEMKSWTDEGRGLLVKGVDRKAAREAEARSYWRAEDRETLREQGLSAMLRGRARRYARRRGWAA